MNRTVLLVAIVVFVGVCLAPAPALGQDVLVERRVESVSGADMAMTVIERLRGVDVGSQGATVTVETSSGPHAVAVNLGNVLADKRDPIAGLAVIAIGASVLLKGAAFVSRLLR